MNNETSVANKALAYQERMHQLKASSQQLIIDSLRSCLSDYALRTKQAEELTGILLTEKLTQEQFMHILNTTIAEQVNDKANERAVHQQQILQATSLAVNNLCIMLRSDDLDENSIVGIRGVAEVISQGLVTALGNMTDFSKPHNQQPTTKPE